jgi:hypothetical protein
MRGFFPLSLSFTEVEMKVEARIDKLFIWTIIGFLIGSPVLISIMLTIALSELWFLLIMILPALVIPFPLRLNNKIKVKIDSEGISNRGIDFGGGFGQGKILWSEIEKINVSTFSVSFSKNRKRIEIPIHLMRTPEVLYVVAHYYPQIRETLPKIMGS